MEDTNEPPKKKLKSTDSHPQQNLYAAANAEVKDGPVSTLNKMTDPANINPSTPYTEETLIQKMRWWLAIHHNSFAAPLAAVHALRQLPCCYHCCLRFVGIQQPWKIYTFTEKHLESFFTNLLEDPRVEKPYLTILRSTVPTNPLSVPCVVCLGTLQNAGSPDFVDPILSKSKAEKYRVLDFSFTLTLPPGALVRNHAVRLHLAEQLSLQNIPTGFDFDKVVDLKEPFRLLVAWRIAEGTRLKHNPYSKLRIVCTFDHPETTEEHLFLTRIPNAGIIRKKITQKHKTIIVADPHQKLIDALKFIHDNDFRICSNVPPKPIDNVAKLKQVAMRHEPIYIGGRYLKFSREYSQTPYPDASVRLRTGNSVSECIAAHLKETFWFDDYRMVAAGREDENVRMLGNGRPFYFELINPRSPRQVQELYPVLQAEINSGPHSDAVKVRHLLKIESINLKAIKAAEETKNKTYCALVWVHKEVTEEMLNTWKDLVNDKFTLQQKTPVCQLQRRVQAIRFKCIYSLAVKPAFDMKDETLDPRKRHFVTVHIHAQAGTYIKEFVHGDLGRTKPSLCDILKENVQMVALDMIDIDIVWPPARKVDIWYGNDNRKAAQMARV